MTATDLHNFKEPQRESRPSRLAVLRAGVARESGVALVEFALILPVALLVFFGIAQFGLALNSANDETHLANEVARYATVNENPGGAVSLQTWAKKEADSNF